MKKVKKGNFGYIKAQRKIEIIKTVGMFGISLALYAIGYITTGEKANLLTIVAVLGCLPASKSAVSMIMYLRAKGCSQELFDFIKAMTNSLWGIYDLYFTSYDKNFQVSHLVIHGKCIVGISESEATDENTCKEHIQSMLQLNGFSDYTVKIFHDKNKYGNRLEQLHALDDGSEKSTEAVSILLHSISL